MRAIALPAISTADGFNRYLAEIRKFPMLEPDEEYMLAKRWSEHADYDAAHRLVTSHLRLVAKIAQGFRGYGLPVVELVSEGNIGLMQAVRKFDPEKGFRLSTYAIWWIRAAIQEYVLRSWSLVKVGSSAAQKRLFFNLRKLKKRIQNANHGALTPEQISEIATELNVREQDVVDMDTRMSAHDPSLHAPISGGDDDRRELIDTIAGNEQSQEEQLAERQEYEGKRSLLHTALATLNAREQHIIRERKLKEPASTLEELSQIYHVSRERIRQIEARAMEKLTAKMAEATG